MPIFEDLVSGNPGSHLKQDGLPRLVIFSCGDFTISAAMVSVPKSRRLHSVLMALGRLAGVSSSSSLIPTNRRLHFLEICSPSSIFLSSKREVLFTRADWQTLSSYNCSRRTTLVSSLSTRPSRSLTATSNSCIDFSAAANRSSF